jgi:hypothetical protein
MMSRLSNVVKRHPLVAFFVLAYALSWWALILYAFDLSPIPVAPLRPFPRRPCGAGHHQWQDWHCGVTAPDGAMADRAQVVRRGPLASRAHRGRHGA